MPRTKPEPEAEELSPNAVDKHTVTVHCDACDVDVEILVPDGHTDAKLRWEHACSNSSVFKGEWINPDAPEVITDPTEDDDVIWDAAQQAYVPRVVANVVDGGQSVEGASKS